MREAPTSGPVTYTHDDFVAFARQIRQKRMKLYRRVALLLLVLMGVTLALYGMLRQPLPVWQVALGIVAAALLWTLASPVVQGRLIAWSARRAGLLANQTFAVTDDGFEARYEGGHSLTHWSAIRDVRVDESQLFLFVSETSAFIVSRRVFGSDAEFESFTAAAAQRWQQRHRL